VGANRIRRAECRRSCGIAVAFTLLVGRVQAEEGDAPSLALEVHGFVSQGFIKTNENNYLANSERGSFEFNEVGINFTKSLTDQLRIGVQLFTRDLGPIGNYSPQFDWFFVDYRFWDWFGIRAGRTKLPFGLYNEISDIDAARVSILLPQSLYSITARDFLLAQTGGELYGLVPLADAGGLEYRAYGGTINTPTSVPNTANVAVPYLVGGRLMWLTPLHGLQVGASVQVIRIDFDYVVPPATVTQLQMAGALPAGFAGTVGVKLPYTLWVGSTEYQMGDLLLAAEYSRWAVKLESAVPTLIPNNQAVSERYYGMASYRLAPWFTPGAYYSVFFQDVDNRHGRAQYQHDISATLRFDLNANWLVKLEGHFMHGTAGLDASLNDNKPLSTLARDWGVFLVKTTAYF
jgi:hypothetical protein